MFVIKRNGKQQPVHFDKISKRISNLCGNDLDREHCDPMLVAQSVCQGVYKGVTTTELDALAVQTAASLASTHSDYSLLAARIAVSCLHKNTELVGGKRGPGRFSRLVEQLRSYRDPKTGEPAPLVAEDLAEVVRRHAKRIDEAIDYGRDNRFDYFGFQTLERSYLLKMNGSIVERPQDMLMRVSLGIHGDDIDAAIRTYDLMSQGFFTHASPTLFNAGTPHPQMSSCFLVHIKGDSIKGIFDTVKDCSEISQYAGGIGCSIHNIRASGSYIRGTNGHSNGIVPMIRVFDATVRYVDQGGGKRKGAIAFYIEPWHADIFDFLDLRKNHGAEHMRARDVMTALWINDLFMERVETNAKWTLFCPKEAPGLSDVWGDEFRQLYERYEREKRGRVQVDAQTLWKAILQAQIETGTPYMLFKDACNSKSNHQHLGTIKCSNLCTEIVQYTTPNETAVCNLASISLPRFVVSDRKIPAVGSIDAASRRFDFDALAAVTETIVDNLNKIIDRNYYPVQEARRSNLRHRPIGVGVQGLADAFILLGLPFESPGAAKLNRDIFETIYHAALTASCRLAKSHGTYESYDGSPVSRGILQFDMWGVTPSERLDWGALRARIARHGVRNSLLVAPMPTASTAQILGNNESFEPYTSNMYVRRALSGDFTVANRHLMHDLVSLRLWTPELRDKLVLANGSVQGIDIPDALKEIYKTVWEISQCSLMKMAKDRGAFIDQSQSFNLHIEAPSFQTLTSAHFFAWKNGLKTGMYYLRTKPAADAIKYTIDMSKAKDSTKAKAAPSCSLLSKEGCEACGA